MLVWLGLIRYSCFFGTKCWQAQRRRRVVAAAATAPAPAEEVPAPHWSLATKSMLREAEALTQRRTCNQLPLLDLCAPPEAGIPGEFPWRNEERALQRGDFAHQGKRKMICAREVIADEANVLLFQPRQCKTHPGICYKFVKEENKVLTDAMRIHTSKSPVLVPWPVSRTKKSLEQHCFRTTQPLVAPSRRALYPDAKELLAADPSEMSTLAQKVVQDLTTKSFFYKQQPTICPMAAQDAKTCQIIRRGHRCSHKYMEPGTIWSLGCR